MKRYLVGGAVRDGLLNLPLKDRDWVVVGGSSQQMLDQGYEQVGRDFPVFLHPCTHEEYALARTERKSGSGYTGFICCFEPDVTLEQDLARRDLTINAIARDSDGHYYDPYNGREDIKRRLLRHVSDAFNEDPLRVLRVARFAASFAHLNFRIADETLALMRDMTTSGELATLTKERVWKETENALLTRNPQIYFQVLRDCGALSVLFPELDNLFGVPARADRQRVIDIGMHKLMVLAKVAQLSSDVDVRFAILFYDVGKNLARQEKWEHHHDNDLASMPLVSALCERLSVPNAVRDLTLLVTEFHELVHTLQNQPAATLVSLFERIDAWRKPQRVEKIAIISEAKACCGDPTYFEKNYYSQSEYLRKAWQVAQNISIKEIVDARFQGINIRKELMRRRIAALEAWTTTYTVHR